MFVRRSGGMADAQASGACSSNTVWVQVPSPARCYFYLEARKSKDFWVSFFAVKDKIFCDLFVTS